MIKSVPLIFNIFSSPSIIKELNEEKWNDLLFQAYKVNHVSRVYALIKNNKLTEHIPSRLLWHFTSAWQFSLAHKRDFIYTLHNLSTHISPLKTEVLLLKGAAYSMSESSVVGDGRLFSDIDIFVKKSHLENIEQILMWSGWQYDTKSEYDIEYYRHWMHELPPMSHPVLPMSIDVHHHIVPIIAKTAFNLAPLISANRASKIEPFRVLTPEAQLIHTAMHMLTNDDVTNVFRDFIDFYLNFAEHNNQKFTLDLTDTARSTQTQVHVYRALRLIRTFFDIKFDNTLGNIISDTTYVEKMVDYLYHQLIIENLNRKDPKNISFCQRLVWLRAHYLKMPFSILIKHGGHKLRHLLTNTRNGLDN